MSFDALKEAIDAFAKEHGNDPRYRRALAALTDAEAQVQHLSREDSYDSPGRAEARDAGKPGEETEIKQERQQEGDQPKTFAEAAAQAKERMTNA